VVALNAETGKIIWVVIYRIPSSLNTT
ncbi:MAG: hypothetical protein EOO92_13510, partial [Pedobacter sp.]